MSRWRKCRVCGKPLDDSRVVDYCPNCRGSTNGGKSSLLSEALFELCNEYIEENHLNRNTIEDKKKELKEDYEACVGKKVGYKDKHKIAAYMCGYLPRNFFKFQWILSRCAEKGIKLIDNQARVIRVLDFGSGPGTILMSIVDYLEKLKKSDPNLLVPKCKVIAIEEEQLFREFLMSACFRKFSSNYLKHEPQKIYKNMDKIRSEKFSLITLSNVICENDMSDSIKTIEDMKTMLYDEGHIVIISPAPKKMIRYQFELTENVGDTYEVVDYIRSDEISPTENPEISAREFDSICYDSRNPLKNRDTYLGNEEECYRPHICNSYGCMVWRRPVEIPESIYDPDGLFKTRTDKTKKEIGKFSFTVLKRRL